MFTARERAMIAQYRRLKDEWCSRCEQICASFRTADALIAALAADRGMMELGGELVVLKQYLPISKMYSTKNEDGNCCLFEVEQAE